MNELINYLTLLYNVLYIELLEGQTTPFVWRPKAWNFSANTCNRRWIATRPGEKRWWLGLKGTWQELQASETRHFLEQKRMLSQGTVELRSDLGARTKSSSMVPLDSEFEAQNLNQTLAAFGSIWFCLSNIIEVVIFTSMFKNDR